MSPNSTSSSMRYLLLATLLAAVVSCPAVRAAIVGTAVIEDCEVFDVDARVCEEKQVITIAVSHGMEVNTEHLIMDPESGLSQTVRIDITKTAPKLLYPLRYFHTVAFYPHEEVIKVGHAPGGYPLCMDCPDALNPTCGWTTDSRGVKYPHSQGFCSSNTFYDFLRNEESCALRRGEELLGRATVIDPFSTGHALRLGELYFHGYELGEYIKSFEIEVKLTSGSKVHKFTLSPNDPIYSTEEGQYDCDEDCPPLPFPSNVKAELLGDLGQYQGAGELDNYILYVPGSPPDHPYVQDYQNNMLLVPREELSKDGGEPDKVGVSFYTFRLLGNTWMISEAGDGLHNQLFQKLNADLQKLNQNPDAEATYLLQRKRMFKDGMEFQPGMSKVLEHRINDISNSLVSLTLDVNSTAALETLSVGYIMNASVEEFASMSEEGTLTVALANGGELRADYVATVTDMSMNILPAIPAQAITLYPTQDTTLLFDISTLYNQESTHYVWVTLKSPQGYIYDGPLQVFFDTQAHQTKYSYELQQKNEGTTNSEDIDPAAIDIMDFNFDGIVNFGDLANFAQHWLHPN